MVLKKIVLISSVLFSCITVLSCTLKPFDDDEIKTGDEIGERIEEKTDLFVNDKNDGKYSFETNDQKYLSEYGYTFWTMTEINSSDKFESLDVDIYKSSGNAGAGYGVIFCQQLIDDKDFMAAVLINTRGQYIVGKVIDGMFEGYSGWKSSAYIKRGYGVINNLRINYEKENDSFLFSVNGYEITRIKVSEPVTFKNSRAGYTVVIDRGEKFPEVPVKVVFEKKGD